MAILAFFLGYGAESYNQVTRARSGILAFDIEPMIDRAVADPFGEGLWLTLMLLTPILPPIFFTANLLTDGLLALQPLDYRLRRLLFRTLGILLASGGIIGVIGLINTTENVDIADLLGNLAREGITVAHDAYGVSSAR